MEIEIDIDKVSSDLSHKRTVRDFAVRYYKFSKLEGVLPWSLAYIANKVSFDTFLDDPTRAYIKFFLEDDLFLQKSQVKLSLLGLKKEIIRSEDFVGQLFLTKLIQSYAFAKVWSDRAVKDANVLLSAKDSLIVYDEFGDRHDSSWKDHLSSYAEDKYLDRISRFLSKNFREARIFAYKVIGNNVVYSMHDYYECTKFDYYKTCWIEFACELVERQNYSDDLIHEDSILSTTNSNNMLEVMSGWEFEKYLAARINNETTMHAEVTKGSGDQGADLIVKGIGLSAVIQAKHYSSKIGNKAVQEAFSARQYYGTGLAIVVANAGYTKSAWQLAEKTGVLAMTEASILDLLKVLSR
ncbi:restriction endonuclease [Halomonas sp. BN3-1]|uniref:restriction endonuclease n=1 Tax=Halomonas sp. BN3-1 TaxID=2082393 RepID=UPI000D33C933|nr:restriction endonuclease [Halomonas sp. BN3-1]